MHKLIQMKRVFFCLAFLLTCCRLNVAAQEVFQAATGSAITIQNGAAMYVDGGMTLADKAVLNNNGSLTINKQANNRADFTDHNVTAYTYGTGTFVFTGTGSQELLSPGRFERIEVNNGGLNLLSDISSNSWYLRSGRINTNSFYAVARSVSPDAVKAGPGNDHFANAWINGNLRRYIDPVKVDQYVFPIGNTADLYMAEMDGLTANPLQGVHFVTAAFGNKPGNDRGLNIRQANTTCMAVDNNGVWHLVTDEVPSGGNYNLRLHINGFGQAGNNDISIIQRPDLSSAAADWVIPAGGLSLTAGTADRYIGRSNLSAFGQFGIGLISRVEPLTGFTGIKAGTSLTVYPNPVVNNEFYVQYGGFTVNGVRLIAADGKIVACNFNSQKSGQLKVTLPLLLGKGIYTLQLNTNIGLQSTMISLQ